MRHYIIGTAGHIDHGKTSLTKRLTNIDTDRLLEEKKRNISIELGFAPLTLPSGQQVSIIDVPGHERFIRHMVAGVGGIDLVLLVVAADEGVMPQTAEHIHILHLLGIRKGIIVITKTDLVDEDFLELVREDIRETVQDTFLRDAPLCLTSTATGEGIEDLTHTIESALSSIPVRSANRPFQLPVDRVFTIKGAGTVVTGTVYSGKVRTGDDVDVLPDKAHAKVRQIQVHGREVSTAYAGQRAALNITQVKKEELSRGQVLAEPGRWSPTRRIDAYVRWLPGAPVIKHQGLVKLYVGSAESEAELILYDRPSLGPEEEAYISLRLHRPVIVSRGDRFILRRPTPAATLGGGEVVQPYARKRKYRPASAESIQRAHRSSLHDRVRHELAAGALVQNITALAQKLTETENDIANAAGGMTEIIEVRPGYLASAERLVEKRDESVKWLRKYHEAHPLRQGPSRAEWVSRHLPGLHSQTIDALLQLWQNHIKVTGDTVSCKTFVPFVPEDLRERSDLLLERIKAKQWQTESWEKEAAFLQIDPETAADLLTFHVHCGNVVVVEGDRVISKDAYIEAKTKVIDFLKRNETLSMQDAKELFGGLSRKYTVPLMELMDRSGITYREGNVRRLAA